MKAVTQDLQAAISPKKALKILKEGNARFQNNQSINRNLLEQVADTSTGQYPFAAILSCIDSRVPTEKVFDQGIGDLFSIRIAGNFVNDDILGSLEFACKIAGAKVIVVMGHTSCGAVKGACDGAKISSACKPSRARTDYSDFLVFLFYLRHIFLAVLSSKSF